MRPVLNNSSKNSKESDSSRVISIFDRRYVNETDDLKITDNINMNNKKIINYEGVDDNDVCTIKNLYVYYRKGSPYILGHFCPIDMNNNKITNCSLGVDENDVCTMKNIRNISITITHCNTDLSMNNNRITSVADGIPLNDAVNVKQWRQFTQARRTGVSNFYRKSKRLTFNRYGVSVIYKSFIDSVAVRVLLISEGSLYIQEPIIIKGEYTLFIPPYIDVSEYTT